MLTREQWESLATFAGLEYTGESYIRTPLGGGHYENKPWQPDSDWNDFGPLWVLLEVWLGDGTTPDQPLHSATWDFECAKMEGDEKILMQAGCLLGAAIGATMTAPTAQESKQ